MLKKIDKPLNMQSNISNGINTIGKYGYDYNKTEQTLRALTRKTLDYATKPKKH